MKTETKTEHTPGPWRYELKVLCDGIDDNGQKINPHTSIDYYSIEAGLGLMEELHGIRIAVVTNQQHVLKNLKPVL